MTMGALTHLFYVISTALLYPVAFGLILALLLALRLLGATIREAYLRRRENARRREFEALLERAECKTAEQTIREHANESGAKASSSPLLTLTACVESANDDALVEKRATEYENRIRESIERAERLARIAPALGLMGTLIPLGPALLGLAKGDLDTLAADLVVAFSTTVVGLAGALVASLCAAVRRRWARRDFVLVNFALERLTNASGDSEIRV